jgi:hypothetical protein
MLAVITVQLKSHSGEAHLLTSLAIPADFTSGSLADKEVYRANCNQYHEGEGY